MTLMRRTAVYFVFNESFKHCVVALPATSNWNWNHGPPLATDDTALPYSKILIATTEYQASLIEQERAELQLALQSTPEVMYEYQSHPPKHIPGTPTSLDTYEFTSERHFLEQALKQLALNPTVLSKDKSSPKQRKHVDGNDVVEYFFYQSTDGQHVYLHPLEIKILKYAFKEYSEFPRELEFQITRVIESTVDEELRSRCKYIDHIPLKCDIGFCHVDLTGIVPKETLDHFQSNDSFVKNDVLEELKSREAICVRKERLSKNQTRSRSASMKLAESVDETERHDINEDTSYFNDSTQISPVDEEPTSTPTSWNGSSFAQIAKKQTTTTTSNTYLRKPTYSDHHTDDTEEDDEYAYHDEGWMLAFEETAYERGSSTMKISTGYGEMTGVSNGSAGNVNRVGATGGGSGRKKGKKGQTVVISNSGGRRRN